MRCAPANNDCDGLGMGDMDQSCFICEQSSLTGFINQLLIPDAQMDCTLSECTTHYGTQYDYLVDKTSKNSFFKYIYIYSGLNFCSGLYFCSSPSFFMGGPFGIDGSQAFVQP